MARSVRSYQREIQGLRSLLSAVEWVQPHYNGSPSCSYCGHQKHFGHAPDCLLAETLHPTSTTMNTPEGPKRG
jgi:hypothetical protein